jgi:hypothetical protein
LWLLYFLKRKMLEKTKPKKKDPRGRHTVFTAEKLRKLFKALED